MAQVDEKICRQDQEPVWRLWYDKLAKPYVRFKYRDTLSDFDPLQTLKELRKDLSSQSGGKISVERATRHYNIIRRHGITSKNLSLMLVEKIIDNFQRSQASDEKLAHFLCLSLKYLILNGPLEETVLTEILLSISNKLRLGHVQGRLGNTMASLAMVCYEKQNIEQVDENLPTLILRLPDLDANITSFFQMISTCKKPLNQTGVNSLNHSRLIKNVSKRDQVVSKAIHTTKHRQQAGESEELKLNALNLSESLRKRNKKTLQTTTKADEPDISHAGYADPLSGLLGSRSTWYTTVHRYEMVCKNKILKDAEKDYVKNDLFGAHTIYSKNKKYRTLYSFFINQICIAIFCKLSRKQALDDSTIIDKLMKCITNFEGLLEVFQLDKDNFVDTLVYLVWRQRGSLKKIESPDFVVTFFNEIMEKVIERVGESGGKQEVREMNKTDFEKPVIKYLNGIRLDAINAIYNCARKNIDVLTTERLERIQECAKITEVAPYADEAFNECIFKLVQLSENLDGFNYQKTFENYLSELEKSVDVMQEQQFNHYIQFFSDQTLDLKRYKELFTEPNLGILLQCLSQTSCSKRKLSILEVMNSVMDHEESIQLSEINLMTLLEVISSNNGKVFRACLPILLLATNKSKQISQKTLEKMMEIFDSQGIIHDEITSFIVFILHPIMSSKEDDQKNQKDRNEQYLNNPSHIELVSSKLFSQHKIKLNQDEDERVKIEKIEKNELADDPSACNKISLMSADIILKSVEKTVQLTPETTDNLMSILMDNSSDKQTKIICAKCFYEKMNYKCSLNNDDLSWLLEMKKSPIFDVRLYIQAIYLKLCAKVASASTSPLNMIHLENISENYLWESMKLGNVDFKGQMNDNFFKILLYEAKKGTEFPDKNIFILFNYILTRDEDEDEVGKVMEILHDYISTHIIPVDTIKALEKFFPVSMHFERILNVLYNVITLHRLPVQNETLEFASNKLQTSEDNYQTFRLFRLLEEVERSQDLPGQIFCQLELLKSGYAMQDIPKQGKEIILEYVEKKLTKGVHLPLHTMEALARDLNQPRALKIFAITSRNEQAIPEHLLNVIIKFYIYSDHKREIDPLCIEIFGNAAKNNQSLPSELMDKLAKELQKNGLDQVVLPIFICFAQRGQELSKAVINKMFDKLISEEKSIQKQELLSAIPSIMEVHEKDIHLYELKIKTILGKELNSNNQCIQKLCVQIFAKLFKFCPQMDDNLLKKLVDLGSSPHTNKTLQAEILMLLKSMPGNSYDSLKIQKMELANLYCTSQEELLERLHNYVSQKVGIEGILPQNYDQLKDILDNGSLPLQQKAVNILLKLSCKTGIPDPLVNSIAILLENSPCNELRESCLQLLNELIGAGKSLTGLSQEIYNQKKHIDQIFKGEICHRLHQELPITEENIAKLLQLSQNSDKIQSSKTLANFIAIFLEENLDLSQNINFAKDPSFRLLIEECLIQKKDLEITLPCYCAIIKKTNNCRIQCLEGIADDFLRNGNTDHQLQVFLLECLYHVNEFTTLTDKCMTYALESMSSESHLVQGFSFSILRKAEQSSHCEKIFKVWCYNLKRGIEQISQKDMKKPDYDDDLDLLEVVVSIKFVDWEIFKKEEHLWKAQLLISDVINQNEFKDGEMLEISKMILDLEFSQVRNMLHTSKPKPFKNIKRNWCMMRLQECFHETVSPTYVKRAAEKLCGSFDTNGIENLLRSLKKTDRFCSFQDLMEFCVEEKVDLSKFDANKLFEINDLIDRIEATHLIQAHFCKIAKKPNQLNFKKFVAVFQQLKRIGWTYKEINDLLRIISEKTKIFQDFVGVLKTLLSYKLPLSSFVESKNRLARSKTFLEALQRVNELCIENHLQKNGKEKDPRELLNEMKTINPSLDMEAIKNIETKKSKVDEWIEKKSNWDEKDIQNWAQKVKSNNMVRLDENEGIAVIYRGNFLKTGHRLTDTQIFCSLLALESTLSNSKGKLLQMATGEGKSTIICILAIIEALKGNKVDVITSSPVLAERDVLQKAGLYSLFDLTCASNKDRTEYIKGKKSCYSSDIVYGDMSQFQFDILRDSYSQLDTLGGRKQVTAIVDEVDSMLIDDTSKVARLSSTVPGMGNFRSIFIFIWFYLNSVKKQLISFSNKTYYVKGKIGFKNNKITLDVIDCEENVFTVPDLEAHITNFNSSDIHETVDDVMEFLRKKLTKDLDQRLEEIYITSNFVSYMNRQKAKWITNAIEALIYEENIHYIIQDGEIKPVDYDSTGIVQSSTRWGGGLHQFLQLKHNLRMTDETVTTNFLSNIGFINKYRQIYGLTGTLGSDNARETLKDVYNVNLFNIPRRQEKLFLELDSLITDNEAEWLDEILSHAVLEVRKGRGILVICQTIMEANLINKMLKKELMKSGQGSVDLYAMNDMGQEKHVEEMHPGKVIVATNLAGRGTDIQTDKIEETGGLHVILTFLPCNQRVEEQAFGRTARQGKRGTGIIILNSQDLALGTSDAKQKRDRIEAQQLDQFKRNDLKLIQLKDKLFETFCKFLNNGIRQQKNTFYSTTENNETCMLAAAEERWAEFLCELDDREISCEEAEAKLNELIDKMKGEMKRDELIKNPYHYITMANDTLANAASWFGSKKYIEEALKLFNHAITLEKRPLIGRGESYLNEKDAKVCSPGAAHLGVGRCHILLQKKDYKKEALQSFETALKCQLHELSVLNSTHILLQQSHHQYNKSTLEEQIKTRISILCSYLHGVEDCVTYLKEFEKQQENKNEEGYIEPHCKSIRDQLGKNSAITHELEEFKSRGIEFIIQLTEKPFPPWVSVCCLNALGICQVGLGLLSIASGVGGGVGLQIVTEGLQDILTAYSAFETGKVSWMDYSMQKGYRIAKFVDVIQNIEKARSAVQFVTSYFFPNKSKSENQTANSKRLFFSEVSKTLVNGACKSGAQYLSDFTFETLKTDICKHVEKSVLQSFNKESDKFLLKKLYAIDVALHGVSDEDSCPRKLSTNIEDMISDIFENDGFQTQSTVKHLVHGIISVALDKHLKPSTAIDQASNHLSTMTAHVTESILKKLTCLSGGDSLNLSKIFCIDLKVKKANSKAFTKLESLKLLDCLSLENNEYSLQKIETDLTSLKERSIPKGDDDIKKCVDFVKRFDEAYRTFEETGLNKLAEFVSNKISDELIKKANSNMAQSLMTEGVDKIVLSASDALKQRFPESFLEEKEQNSEAHDKYQKRYDELSTKDSRENGQEERHQRKYQGHSSSTNEDRKMEQKPRPVDLPVMMAATENYGIKLKIVDQKNYCPTQEDIEGNFQVIYAEFDRDRKLSLILWINKPERSGKANKDIENCFFKTLSEILKENKDIQLSPDSLRNETGHYIISNANKFSKPFVAEERMRNFLSPLSADTKCTVMELMTDCPMASSNSLQDNEMKNDAEGGSHKNESKEKRSILDLFFSIDLL